MKKERRFSYPRLRVFQGIDKSLLFSLIGLCVFGLIAVFNSSAVSAFRDFHDQYHYIKDQGLYLTVGLVGLIIVSTVDYKKWYKFAVPLLFMTILFLIAVFIPGIGVKIMGAKRWINLGFTLIQPTEFAKLIIVIYLSAWFAYKEKGRFMPFMVFLGLILGLIVLQPDLGTGVIILGIAAVLYFVSGAKLTYFLYLIPIIIIGIGILAIVVPYRFARVTTFFNPNYDPLGTSYHYRQVLIALGSGGLFGVGLGKSRQKFEYLPEANTDSIFAIIAEEVGFFGSLVFILIFVYISYRCFLIARQAPDKFGQLLATGIGSWFAIQSIMNLSSMVGLLPLTGIPLPLISYGGSNLISILIGFGIVLNISRQTLNKKS